MRWRKEAHSECHRQVFPRKGLSTFSFQHSKKDRGMLWLVTAKNPDIYTPHFSWKKNNQFVLTKYPAANRSEQKESLTHKCIQTN